MYLGSRVHDAGCAKTYVRLSGTGRNLVQTCIPLTWLFCGTSTFLIRKNKETAENCLQITVKFILKVIKANLVLDKIRLNIPFNFTIPQSFSFVFRSSILGLSQKQFTRVIMWLKTWNSWLFLSFEFWAKLFWTTKFDNYSACPKDKWMGKFFSYSVHVWVYPLWIISIFLLL